MSIKNNLLPRLQLLRIALTRRFVFTDVVAMAREYGFDYTDLCGDSGPFDFLSRFGPALESPPAFARLVAPQSSFVPAGAPAAFNSEPSVARFLGQLAFYRRARTIIELGCFVGWTTAHMACALAARDGGCIHALDIDQGTLDTMQANLRRHGWGQLVRPVRGFSLEAGTQATLPPQADIIFLDTSHTYPETLHEIRTYAPRLTPNGFFVLHDSTSTVGVRRSVFEVRHEFHIHTFATERSNGLTILSPR